MNCNLYIIYISWIVKLCYIFLDSKSASNFFPLHWDAFAVEIKGTNKVLFRDNKTRMHMTFYHLTLYFKLAKKSTSIDIFQTQRSYFSNVTVTMKTQMYLEGFHEIRSEKNCPQYLTLGSICRPVFPFFFLLKSGLSTSRQKSWIVGGRVCAARIP